MPHVPIQYDRGEGGQTRQDGHADVTPDALASGFPEAVREGPASMAWRRGGLTVVRVAVTLLPSTSS